MGEGQATRPSTGKNDGGGAAPAAAIVLCGEAGQGIQTVETVMSRLLGSAGLHVFSTKEYMSRVRGGQNSTLLRVSSGPVRALVDRIDLLIGLTPDVSTITCMYVLDQKETPGLGANITTESFQKQFQDIPAAEQVVVVKTEPTQPNQIRALAGATISSESVAEIVNNAVADVREPLQRLARG